MKGYFNPPLKQRTTTSQPKAITLSLYDFLLLTGVFPVAPTDTCRIS